MIIKSYCKINLSLRVLKKKMNGLHDIQTNTILLSLSDKIKIKKIIGDKDIIIFKGRFKNFIKKNDNTVSNSLRTLRKNNLIKKNLRYKIIINKNIPVFSGLGGGSSNAAFLMRYFLKNKINSIIKKKIETSAGTDLNLFFQKQCFQKKLDRIMKYRKDHKLYFVLVLPDFKCSTKEIYAKVKNYSRPSLINFSEIKSTDKFISLIAKEKNDLEKIVNSKSSKLKKIKSFLSIQKDCFFARMTGSGSACFAMFKSEKSANLCLKTVKRKFPNYWSVATKTI